MDYVLPQSFESCVLGSCERKQTLKKKYKGNLMIKSQKKNNS